MKKIFLLLLFIFFSISQFSAHAHSGGVSTVTIDNKAPKEYAKEEFSEIGAEIVPEDIASGKYLVNKQIVFEVDPEKLPVTSEILVNTTFNWDFGDGKKTKGQSVTHIYKKIGSYVVKLEIDYGDLEKPELNYPPNEMGVQSFEYPENQYQSILIHVLPTEKYKIPSPTIIIDSKEIKDPIRETPRFSFYNNFLFFKFPKTFTFDASRSQGSAEINSYLWDFGDGGKSTKSKTRHRFKEKSYFHTVGLKITDKNGFFTYSQINLSDNEAFEK